MSHDFARSQRIRKESSGRSPSRKKSNGVPSWLWLLVGTLAGCLIMFLVYLSGVRPPVPAPATPVTATAPATTTTMPSEQPPAQPKRVSPVFDFYTKLPEGGQPVTDIAPAAQHNNAANTVPQPAQTQVVQPATPVQTNTTAQPFAAAQGSTFETITTPTKPESSAQKEKVVEKPASAATVSMDPIEQLLAQKEKEKLAKASSAKSTTAKPATAATTSGARYLQAGVFRNAVEAEKLRGKLSRLGVSASIRTVSNANGETLQKVVAGPFRTSQEADNARVMLSGNGMSTIPVK